MSAKRILWLGMFSEKVKEIIKEEVPEGFSIDFISSKTDREEHLRLIKEADYVSPSDFKIPDDYIFAAKNLKLIQTWGAGTNNMNKELLKQQGIALQNSVGFNAQAVAEMAILHMLAVNRQLPMVDRSVRDGKWINTSLREANHSIEGMTIGLLGMGNIGRYVAKYAYGLDAGKVLYYDIRRLSSEEERERGVEFRSMEDILKESDIVSIHMPLTESTKGLLNREKLSMMRPSAILINTARGAIVDEEALYDALKNRSLRGAGLDTFDSEPPKPDNPLFELDNVVLTCHVGGAVVENIRPRVRHVYEEIVKFENGGQAEPKYAAFFG